MIIGLTTLNLLCLFILMMGIFNEGGIIKISTLTITVFSFLYVIVSGLFFWIDSFNFVHVLGTILILTASLIIYRLMRKPIEWRKMLCFNHISTIEVVLIVFAFLLSFQNFELFSNGQDQGLYQSEAIELYMGNYEVEHDFEEYHILEREEDREAYLNMLEDNVPGYYPLSEFYDRIGFEMSEPKSDVSGMYHGIQTFPAILALGGRLFGLENMMQVQTIFFICCVMLLYYAICNIKITTAQTIGSLTIFLLSPLGLWISKTAFTEMFLTLCMSFYLFLITESESQIKRLLLGLPLVGFSFVHVSFLIIYPVFILINALLFLQNKQKEFIWVNLITSIGLVSGYSMMAYLGPQYFFDNISRLYFKDIITIQNFLYWVFFGCVITSGISLILLCIKDTDALFQKIRYVCKLAPILNLVLLCIIFANIIIIGFFRLPEDGWRIDLCSYYGGGFYSAFSHSSIFAFAMATGFFAIVCVFWYMIYCHKTIWDSPIKIAVYFLILYCILFQSAFIRKEVNYYYYYSRYLVFYIPLLCMAFAFLFGQIKSRICSTLLVFSIVFMLVFDVPMLCSKDQTYLEWETLQDLDMAIQDDSAIILGSGMAILLGPTVRAVTGESIFPVMPDTKNEIEMLKERYTNVYCLSSEGPLVEDSEIIYRDRYLFQNTEVRAGHFPLKYSAEERELILYKIRNPIFQYSLHMLPTGFSVNGFSGIEATGRWTNEHNAKIACYLPSNHYQMAIDVNPIPLGPLGLDSYTANIYINKKHIGDIVLTKDVPAGTRFFDVPKEYMEDGDNEVIIACEYLWSPSSYGSGDSRTLGIFVKDIMFTPIDQH